MPKAGSSSSGEHGGDADASPERVDHRDRRLRGRQAVATFTTTGGNPYFVYQGDVLTLTAPATQDTALADLVGYIALQ